MEVLHTLHMDLCGPMRVQSINGKRYILVIVDDYSRFTWVKFLRSKDETPEFVINFLKQIQVGVGIFYQKSVPRTPQQNGVVERQNRTLVEASSTYVIFSTHDASVGQRLSLLLCLPQKSDSLIQYSPQPETPYEPLCNDKKADPDISRVFGAMCYPTNDSED
ncbi:retrovirus-related pol polyprotein from transposon TNT 1-94 [Tanacetum coccineum]